MLKLPTNPKRRKRVLENLQEAQIARFWIGKIKSADRAGNFQPINAQASAELRKPEAKSRRPTTLYVVRFTSLLDPALIFIKIGVTSTTLASRFFRDSKRYRLLPLKQVSSLSRMDALELERSMLVFLDNHKARPIQPLLSGGNSECFPWSEELEKKLISWTSSMEERLLRK